jgi:uncharacterized protein (TIGR00645 family)
MDKSSEPQLAAERMIERAIFASRWLLAPFYVGLALSLMVLLIKFAEKTANLVANTPHYDSNEVTTEVLSLIDLSLLANLLLMVMFAGYENFVARFELENHRYRPSWMGRVDFGELKLKLLTSIVAITAIHVLESFMNIGGESDRDLAWSVGILIGFVLSGVLLAIMGRVSVPPGRGRQP